MSKIIYRGPSLIDGSPIVVVALTGKSRNSKTGAMMQTYILCDNGLSPMQNSKNGSDYSICGDCIHRGESHNDPDRATAKNSSCYVTLMHGPNIVFKNIQAGSYQLAQGHDQIKKLGSGWFVRLGTYGDPAAVPSYIWSSLLADAEGHTGYSHQKGLKSAEFKPAIMMQSADTEQEARQAWQSGHRTFRTITSLDQIVKGKEILCPASEEAGKKTNCLKCGLCSGSETKAKNIAIVVHGNGSKHFAA